ncbi:hypothetical protein NUU61_003147 [Penicillium alfredii]|uniref:Peroxisomal membrane protein PEX14 n=1 Tax=Penicillium alfredii TaxID=1506179 RepID=A0A9W9FTJ1_9EURO|nr:uncharacterized protein NUU61_003147 [Penicillium alfredii]KAJ5105800.1 hypothetical protein NUU61_003147 [Penicillium alfredii]
MSDSTKPPSISSWQRPGNAPDSGPSSSSSPSPSSDAAPAIASASTRPDLLDQASRFLEDESIRYAPTDRKISFLESKGLNSVEIQQLLGVSRNVEASSDSGDAAESKTREEATQSSPDQAQSSSSPSSSSSLTSAPAPSDAMSPSPSAATPASIPRDVPPIITYPEFLYEQSKPPPLVTMRSVLYTLYGAAGLGATAYSTSEYLVKPMLATLSSARHDLATTAQENLQKLNEKLEQNVSVIPAHLTARKSRTASEEEEADEDTDSVTSDPTELFHRDVATQTSPDFPPASKSSNSPNAVPSPSTAVTTHLTRLESIQNQLRDLADTEKDASALDDSMRSHLSELHHYCDGLIYSAPNYSTPGASYGVYGGNMSGFDSGAAGVRKTEDEAIASFRADIRGVKGALLSARNFPSSRGGRLGSIPAVGR